MSIVSSATPLTGMAMIAQSADLIRYEREKMIESLANIEEWATKMSFAAQTERLKLEEGT